VSTNNDRTTAIHEAAHAIIALATGGRVSHVKINRNPTPGQRKGEVLARYQRNVAGESSRALVALAGYAAEWWHTSGGNVRQVRAALRSGESLAVEQDFICHRNAVKHATRMQRGPMRYSRERITDDAIEHTIHLVRKHWPAIVEVAWHLNRLGALSGAGVEFTYECSLTDPMEV
jgi:hypothetical protein